MNHSKHPSLTQFSQASICLSADTQYLCHNSGVTVVPAKMNSSKATGPKRLLTAYDCLPLPPGKGELFTNTLTTEILSWDQPSKMARLPNISHSQLVKSLSKSSLLTLLFVFILQFTATSLHKMKRCPWTPLLPVLFLCAKPPGGKSVSE